MKDNGLDAWINRFKDLLLFINQYALEIIFAIVLVVMVVLLIILSCVVINEIGFIRAFCGFGVSIVVAGSICIIGYGVNMLTGKYWVKLMEWARK